MCNEYENLDLLIRGALVSIFRRRLARDEIESELAIALMKGQRADQLPDNLRARIGGRVCEVMRYPLLSESGRKRVPRVAARRRSDLALRGRSALFSTARRTTSYPRLSVCVGEAP